MVKVSRAGNHVTTRMDGAVVGDDVSWLAESMHFAQEPAEVSENCEFSCLNAVGVHHDFGLGIADIS